jgi:hypothetical protein
VSNPEKTDKFSILPNKFPSLAEFLGALVQETARARMFADMESIRIAEAYYRDPYLRYLPIPHFKMPEVSIEMPVAVMQLNASKVKNSTVLLNMRTRVKNDLSKCLAKLLLALKEEEDKSVINQWTLRTMPAPKSVVEEVALAEQLKEPCERLTQAVFKSSTDDAPIRLTELADDLEFVLSRELLRGRDRAERPEKSEKSEKPEKSERHDRPDRPDYLSYFGTKKKKAQALEEDEETPQPRRRRHGRRHGAISEEDESTLKQILRLVREMFLNSITHLLKEDENTRFLEVRGGTSDVIEMGEHKYLTTIKVTMREQDFQWSFGESDDGSGIEEERRLLIE